MQYLVLLTKNIKNPNSLAQTDAGRKKIKIMVLTYKFSNEVLIKLILLLTVAVNGRFNAVLPRVSNWRFLLPIIK